jgi:hypothetical protein
MSDMLPKLIGSLFLFVFAATIGGIHSYGWWIRQAAAQASQLPVTPLPTVGQVQVAQPQHWRSLIVHP